MKRRRGEQSSQSGMDATEDQLITEEDSGHPLKALPEQEIHKAVFDCKPDKIPGPDGFQRIFPWVYKKMKEYGIVLRTM
ncbi:hypothetical protein IEQ34_023467 [Dendrobium chrysotoxum]|uniref:Uncharacterized protein n=1 Tax=Dendrobium chrysotoxum TaxID=161865 RepID=A0AAV7FWD5_DENCH|nr:hypothetical protein IEQ34_025847 [Dendrobium chrysotoxum]KAH0439609.1 hypothetical protein IEQ34_025892 [Dendrobium chrysotoxum]KAH0447649.1 hypothetical protein IEQ34_023508 [Dendrobium chrysotoxum]KAH0447700.1 hypothetical protein IEQ34_023459 [Dendrobium chrysotoxum]KAH0447708.1 hypothetical protein IEQ34_023467 [Dendrobium chrysotoxum]